MDEFGLESVRSVVEAALAEDVGAGDLTTLATVPAELKGRALMIAREPLVVAGLSLAEIVWHRVSVELEFERHATDGAQVGAGEPLGRVSGPVGAMLTGERVALNFLQRLSGIATLTRQYVEAVAGTGAVILDTRKTTPGMRGLEKYAVRCGGGGNHRMGLYDAVLIKDNHLAALRGEAPNSIVEAVARVRRRFPGLSVEVEADSIEQVNEALEAGADRVLLDNMSLEQLRQAVGLTRGLAKTEASGGVNLQTVRSIAETGVDYISVGALTHSARAVDIGLDWEISPDASCPSKSDLRNR
ncbi:MAG: carboxylating nicotinate-nucleotide diphosphorylase [Verrucomicrobia bacterium]|nr:carboxylating nicotinate-nucleotide diphosphorylase [Verrucomicrobiota bacterium]